MMQFVFSKHGPTAGALRAVFTKLLICPVCLAAWEPGTSNRVTACAHTFMRPNHTCGTPVKSVIICNNPIYRLGLLRPELNCLKMVACTFSAYHHLKFTNAARFQSSGDLDPLQPFTQQVQLQFLGSFAEVLKTEAIELGCFARSFDPVEFTRYVNGQCALELPQ